MDIQSYLSLYHLTSDNAVVIGSGILQAVGLRAAHDVEVLVTQEQYQKIYATGTCVQKEQHGGLWLQKEGFSVGTTWTVVDQTWNFDALIDHSEIINGVRYITVEFLFHSKSQWLLHGEFRQKDKDDIVLMDAYLAEKEAALGCKCC